MSHHFFLQFRPPLEGSTSCSVSTFLEKDMADCHWQFTAALHFAVRFRSYCVNFIKNSTFSKLGKMFSVPSSLPPPQKGVLHPVHLTKLISLEKVCFRLLDKKKDYVQMFEELQRYYADKEIYSIGTLQEKCLSDRFCILKRDNVYHRAVITNSWPSKTYHVKLVDEGFNYIASEKELFLNTNHKFAMYPSAQAFTMPLHIDRLLLAKKKMYMLNYGLQKIANSKTDFYIVITNEDKVRLYFKDQNNNMLSVNDFLNAFLMNSID